MRVLQEGRLAKARRWRICFCYLQAADRSVQTVMGAQLNLRIPVRVLGTEKAQRLRALVDTEAEICLVRKGLVEPHQLRPVVSPLRLRTANGQALGGGQFEALLAFQMYAKDEATGKEMLVRLPTWCYEADIREDLILSYSWCQSRGMEVVAPQHGLRCKRNGRSAWIPGMEHEINENLVSVLAVEEGKWALCLGAGPGVVGALQEKSYRVLSVGSSICSVGSAVCFFFLG